VLFFPAAGILGRRRQGVRGARRRRAAELDARVAPPPFGEARPPRERPLRPRNTPFPLVGLLARARIRRSRLRALPAIDAARAAPARRQVLLRRQPPRGTRMQRGQSAGALREQIAHDNFGGWASSAHEARRAEARSAAWVSRLGEAGAERGRKDGSTAGGPEGALGHAPRPAREAASGDPCGCRVR